MTAQDYKAPESVGRLQQRALLAGAVGLVLCVIGYVKSPENFLHSYLLAFIFVLGLSLGSLGLLMLQHLTGGHWGIVIRRPLESATRSLPLVAVLFLPIFFGMKYLYCAWLDAPAPEQGSLSEFQHSYLTRTVSRFAPLIYFAVWLSLMFLFNRWSQRAGCQSRRPLSAPQPENGGGPRHHSLRFRDELCGHRLGDVALAALGFHHLWLPVRRRTAHLFDVADDRRHRAAGGTEPFSGVVQKRHLHDLGKLLLAFVMLWAYFDFSQLLIIWSGNQPEEISFYRSRLYGGWGVVAVIVLIFHFFVPFFLLLSRDLKRNPRLLPKVALWLIFMRFVDLFWMTRPEFYFQRHAECLGSCRAAGAGRPVVLRLCLAIEAAAASPAGRPQTRGGHRAA